MQELLKALTLYSNYNKNKELRSGSEPSPQGVLYWTELSFQFYDTEYVCATFYSQKVNDCPEVEYFMMKDGEHDHDITSRQFFNLIK